MVETIFIYLIFLFLCMSFTYMTPRRIYGDNTVELNGLKYFLTCSMPIILYTFFWGIRDNVGSDYNSYRDLFYTVTYEDNKFEPIYNFLNIFFRDLGLSHVSIFVTTSFLSISSLFYISRYESREFAIFLLYFFFTTGVVLFYQNGVRQAAAFSFLIILVSRIDRYNLFQLFILGFLAWGFHKSSLLPSILIGLFYFLPKLRLNKFILIALLLFCSFYGSSFYEYIYEKLSFLIEFLDYSSYENRISDFEKTVALSSGLGFFLKLIMNIFVIYSQDDLLASKNKSPLYYFYILFLIGIMLEPIIMQNDILRRLNVYFLFTKFILYTYLCSTLFCKTWIKLAICTFYILANFTLFISALLSNSNYCVPYKTIF